jgi:transcriptional regulator with XRE-family HTH domain
MAVIGDSIREARRRAGLSQRALAERCGIHQSVISRLENGQMPNLRWWRFAALVAVLGPAWDPTSRDEYRRRW